MTSNYQLFLAGEGQPPHFRWSRSIAEWKAFRGGSVMMPVGRSFSWDDFESAHLLQFLPFEEARLGDRTLDIALFDFGEKLVGRTLSASDIHSLFGRGIILDEGLLARYLVLVGWWTVFFPWDWEAAIHFPPVDLLWFLLKHVTAPGFDQSKQHVTPFRVGMASLARTPWDQLAGLCTRYGVLAGNDWPPSRPTTHGERYAILRKVRQAMYASMTFPCIPVWTAWLTGGDLGDEDLGRLFESLGGG